MPTPSREATSRVDRFERALRNMVDLRAEWPDEDYEEEISLIEVEMEEAETELNHARESLYEYLAYLESPKVGHDDPEPIGC